MAIRLNREGMFGVLTMGCLLVVPATAVGQSVGMLQDERGVTACSPGYEDYRNGTGVIYGGATPQSAPINYSYSYAGGSPDSADVNQSASANFGHLFVATSGSATGGGGNGAFTWSDTFWGGDVVVGFYDVIVPNEDMNVEFKYTVTGQSGFQANSEGGTDANTTTNFYFGSYSGADDFALNGTKTYDSVVHLYANTEYQLFAGLGWDCAANSANGSPETASFDMAATGTVSIFDLTPGGSFRSFSGYAYAVPEPSSFGVLGLGALGILIRKRRKSN